MFEFGEQYRDFIYIADVLRANLAAVEADAGGVYNVCTGKNATFNDMIDCLNGALGTKLQAEYFKNPYGFYQNETLGDPKLAKKRMGFSAAYDLEKGIRDYFKGQKVAAGV